jgi:putative ABC transport system permease protein
MEATLDASARAELTQPAAPPPGGGPRLQPYPTEPAAARSAERLRTVVYGLSAALLLLGAVNLLATALLSVAERIRDIGLIRALGAGSRQVAALVLSSEALRALVAAVAGLPLGLLAFRIAYVADNGSAAGLGAPAAWQLAAAVPLATLVAVAVCSPAALTATRVDPGTALRAVRE